MQTLKRSHPELSELVAVLVYAKHQAAAARETAEVRAVLAELIRRGHDSKRLAVALVTGEALRPNA